MAARSRSRPLSIDKMLFYLEQVCSGLAHAHGCGVIHRDIKPQNLLLTADGQVVKIADFGVARFEATEGAITRVGTNIYSAPEHNPLVQTAQLDSGSLSSSSEHVTPAAAWLIRPAASDESAAAAPGSRITGNARVPRPPGWLISRRPGSGQRIAARIRAGLAFTGGLCDGPGFQGDAVRWRGSPFTRGCPRSGFRAGRMLSGPAAGTLRPPGLSPAEQRRPAADIWQAVPKEVTPCRTSREEQPGQTS